MSAIVQKYGGTSVEDVEHIRAVARRVVATRRAGNDVVVVVSAMGQTTDRFDELCRQISPNEHPRERDMLLTAGERISMALLAMAIRDLGVEAVSLTGSQAGILTDTVHGRAEIQDVRAFRVKEHLDRGHVVIVAGFQGVSAANKEITTLGRGGSDVTAVAMAAYLQAACEVYKDVDGVHTADPRVVPGARLLAEVSFDEMAELARAGAQVLALRSVEYGRRLGVPLHVRSSFHERPGTWVRAATAAPKPLTGVAHVADQVLVMLGEAPRPDAPAELAEGLAGLGVEIDMAGPVASGEGRAAFAVSAGEAPAARRALGILGWGEVETRGSLGKVSLVGREIGSDPELVRQVPEALAGVGIEIAASRSYPLRVSCLVPEERLGEAVRVLHEAFLEGAR